MALNVSSSAFEPGERIPQRHTCDGEDLSPPLAWHEVPEGTEEVILICEDPDAEGGVFTHWLLYGISPLRETLPEGLDRRPRLSWGALQGRNDLGGIGYRGPCPERGPDAHHYQFRLFALDEALDLPPGVNREQLISYVERHAIERATLIGTYQRP